MSCSGGLCAGICGVLCVGGCAAGCFATSGIGFAVASFYTFHGGTMSAAATALATS